VIINVSKIWAPQTLTDGLSAGNDCPPEGRGFNEKSPRLLTQLEATRWNSTRENARKEKARPMEI